MLSKRTPPFSCLSGLWGLFLLVVKGSGGWELWLFLLCHSRKLFLQSDWNFRKEWISRHFTGPAFTMPLWISRVRHCKLSKKVSFSYSMPDVVNARVHLKILTFLTHLPMSDVCIHSFSYSHVSDQNFTCVECWPPTLILSSDSVCGHLVLHIKTCLA